MRGFENRYELAHLISCRLMGTITPEEEERFQKWWKESESHEKEYEIICKRLIVDLRRTEHPDLHKAWKGVWSKLPRTRRLFWSWHSGAAVCAGVILLLGLGWIFLPADDLNISRSGNDRCAGTVLILGNGELIDLGKRQERVVDAGKGTKIRIGENVVSYQTGEQEEAPVQEMNTVRVPRGNEYRLILSDGTKVWLNASSTLEYPASFEGKKERRVRLTGEAFFEVCRNEKCPFYVETGNQESVQVLGTSFNINAYPENSKHFTTLVTGKISYQVEEGKEPIILSPDQQVSFDCVSGDMKVAQVDASAFTAWKDGWIYFEDETLPDLAKRLSRVYGVEIKVAERLRNYSFSGKISYERGVDYITRLMEETNGVVCEVENGVLWLR